MTKSKNDKELQVSENKVAKKSAVGMNDLLGMQGLGLENVQNSDIVFPFINIIQSNSPQRKKGKEGYIEGAEEGMMYNTTTKQIYDPNIGIKVVPLYHEKRYIERTPRKEGEQQKFLKDYQCNKDCVKNLKKIDNWTYLTEDNTWIIPTDYIYFLVLNSDTNEHEFAVISFKSSLARQARDILSQAKMRSISLPDGTKFRPPVFYRSLIIKTVMKSGNDNDWFVYSISQSDDLVKFDNEGTIIENMKGGLDIFENAFHLCNDVLASGQHMVDSSQDEISLGANDGF